MNRINITINSRIYTVVADEETEYLKSLCDYVNEKVELVHREGNHVTGEKPLVLAALNICDEYFKLLSDSKPSEKVTDVISENNRLEKRVRELEKSEEETSNALSETREELDLTQKVLEETEEKIKFLEGQITLKENKIKSQRSEFALREKELLDMLESK